MKYFIATDLHGSAYWAEKVVQQFKTEKADVLVLLGDIYNHGPRNPFPQEYNPLRVSEILATVSDKLMVIKGNCDSEVDQMISNFTFLQDQLVYCGNRRLYFTHGHVYNKDNMPQFAKGDVLFYGHFHKNELFVDTDHICVCIASCALPKDVATYCVVDEKKLELKTFDGNLFLSKKF